MKYIQCPEVYTGNKKSLFLAGGISNCKNWQAELVDLLKDTNLVLINPRRQNFDSNNKKLEEEQINWEFKHLKKASAVSFWFPPETTCPITLYELGKVSAERKPLFIGVDKKYSRIKDVEIQTKLIRPEVQIVYALETLAERIKKWANGEFL